MNQWSIRRKRIILSFIVLILIVLIGVPVFFLLYRTPTCFDNKQNGDETGVDCGGSCQLLCTAESLPIISKGDPRILEIADNTFETVALMENPNVNADIYRAGYTFKLYDAVGIVPIKVIEGETYVPKGKTFVIFEGPFNLEDGVIPTRVVFEWKRESLVWRKNIIETPEIVVRDVNLSRENTSPRLSANIENISLENVSNVDLTALIYDETDNIFAVSKTFIDVLPMRGSTPVVFTWPGQFDKEVLSVNVIIRILPDGSFIK
jgi:hypothetical protein